MTEQMLIDTGPIVAILCREDTSHLKCVEVLRSLDAELFTCWPVVSEAIFLLGRRGDRVQSLLTLLASGAIQCVNVNADNAVLAWLTCFYERFDEHSPDLADAMLVYLAERDDMEKIFTLDYRDFAIYRTSNNRALNVVGD